MSRFNPDLTRKARKGEIAILNDGSVEELREVIKECWPDDTSAVYADSRFYKKHRDMSGWDANVHPPNLPAHSVKDFFMNTKEPEIVWDSESFVKDDRPRTYRVTREQMQDIYQHSSNGWEVINKIMEDKFGLFSYDAKLTDTDVSMLNSIVPDPDILKGIFPEYFFIPEGEAVLVRDTTEQPWVIRVSSGDGKVYTNGNLSGPTNNFDYIIPFTKNPPK